MVRFLPPAKQEEPGQLQPKEAAQQQQQPHYTGLEMPSNLSFPRLDRESWRGVGGRRALRAQETSPTCSPSHTLLLTWTPEMLHPHPQYFLLPKNGAPSQYLSCLLSYFLY